MLISNITQSLCQILIRINLQFLPRPHKPQQTESKLIRNDFNGIIIIEINILMLVSII